MARDRSSPHFLRFAQALALVAGSSSIAGCYGDHRTVRTPDAGPRADVPVVADAPPPCSTCSCGWEIVDAGQPACDSVGMWECCVAVGPCAPPDLAA